MTNGRSGLTRRAWAIAAADLRQLRRSRDFWLPLAIIAALFFVVLPALLLTSITSVDSPRMLEQLEDLLDTVPAAVREGARGDTPAVQAAYALAVYLFAPLGIIVPITVSSAIGTHTIIGERERGSGEFLAHSPASEREIFVGKLLSALLPGYGTCFVGFVAYSLVVNVTVGPSLGGWFFPTAHWVLLIAWVVPPFLALVVSLILAISARVSSAAAAQQASALVTLPLIVLAYALATNSLFRAGLFGGAVGLVAWAGAALALWRGTHAVRRERLLGLGGG